MLSLLFKFIKHFFGRDGSGKDDQICTGKVDMEGIFENVTKTQDRRRRIYENSPGVCPLGAIKTIGRFTEDNPNNISKYPLWRIKGKIGDDEIEACINANPKARIISFYVNGPAQEYFPLRASDPMFNVSTGEFRVVFKENNFLVDAIKHWLREEHERAIAIEDRYR